jgi:aminodeoxychorismate lyase
MIVFLNGQFVSESQAVVSVFDRAFLYGDGLFETMRVANGRVFRWSQHLHRLQRGAEFLGLKLPSTGETLLASARELIQRNQLSDALLRLTVSRGVGLRGYSPKGADRPTLVMSLHPYASPATTPVHWQAQLASIRLPAGEALAQFKTCNKLAQILARAEAEANDADEALLLNTAGHVVEGASGNLFWVRDGEVCTPPLASGVLAGVTRQVVLELCPALQLTWREANVTPESLRAADGAFLSLSSHGVVELTSLAGAPLPSAPVTMRLWRAYHELVAAECR